MQASGSSIGVEYTLTDGSVEQYPRLQQSTLTYRPCSILPKIEAIAYTRKRQHCMIRQMTVTATATVGLGNGVVSSSLINWD